jgi:hypothetical protein
MGMDMELIRDTDYSEVVIAEWRKFYPLHDWFDKHIDSNSNAMWSKFLLSRNVMMNLLSDINEVLADHNKVYELFPSWSYDINDNFYFERLRYTKNILELCLQDRLGSYYYHAYI